MALASRRRAKPAQHPKPRRRARKSSTEKADGARIRQWRSGCESQSAIKRNHRWIDPSRLDASLFCRQISNDWQLKALAFECFKNAHDPADKEGDRAHCINDPPENRNNS